MSNLQIETATFTPEELLGPLNDIEEKHAPNELFVSGNTNLLNGSPRVAVIGTRKPSAMGAARAEKMVRELVHAGIIVVSGLARGIDTIAHRTAIATGGRTIAVLGTPLDQAYPKENYELQMEIAEKHLAISQFPLGYPIQPRNFPIRNRTMALISNASVIIEAGEGSGTRSQGWEALRLGRRLYILKSVVDNKLLKWPKEMIEYGAVSLSDPSFVIENLPTSGAPIDWHVTF